MNKTKLLCKILAVTLALSALSGCSKGISSYEKLIEQLQTAMNEQDPELLAQVYVTEGMFAYAEKEKDIDRDDALDELEDYIDDAYDEWERWYGDDIVITIDLKDAEKIEKEKDIKKLVKAYEKEFDEEIEIKEAYNLECKMKIKGEDDSEKITNEFTAINIKGQGWKIAIAGFVSASQVTSANSTAASIKNNVDTFLTDADTAGYGMKQGNNFSQFYITVETEDDVTVWTVSAASTPSSFKGPAGKWGVTAGSATVSTNKTTSDSAEQLLAIELSKLFPDLEEASFFVSCQGGKCVAVAYAMETSDKIELGEDCPDIDASTGKWAEGFEWSDDLDGVTKDDLIVGTAPQYTD